MDAWLKGLISVFYDVDATNPLGNERTANPTRAMTDPAPPAELTRKLTPDPDDCRCDELKELGSATAARLTTVGHTERTVELGR